MNSVVKTLSEFDPSGLLNSFGAKGTALFFGPNYVITVGHNLHQLYDGEVVIANEIKVYRDGEYDYPNEADINLKSNSINFIRDFDQSPIAENDLATFKTDSNVDNSDTSGIAVFYDVNDMQNKDYKLFGYPSSIVNQVKYSGKILEIKDGYFTAEASPEPVQGVSGGGYFLASELNEESNNYILGIHSGDSTIDNKDKAVYITPQELIEISLDAKSDIAQSDWNDIAPNLLYGSNGDDSMEGTFRRDHIFGREGNDTIAGRESDDYINGGKGDDFIFGNEGKDVIIGGDGLDTLLGGNGDDIIFTGLGTTQITGGGTITTADLVSGGDDYSDSAANGNDVIFIGVGHGTTAIGGGGDDIFIAGAVDNSDSAVYMSANPNQGLFGFDHLISSGHGNDKVVVDFASKDLYVLDDSDNSAILYDKATDDQVIEIKGVAIRDGSVEQTYGLGFGTVYKLYIDGNGNGFYSSDATDKVYTLYYNGQNNSTSFYNQNERIIDNNPSIIVQNYNPDSGHFGISTEDCYFGEVISGNGILDQTGGDVGYAFLERNIVACRGEAIDFINANVDAVTQFRHGFSIYDEARVQEILNATGGANGVLKNALSNKFIYSNYSVLDWMGDPIRQEGDGNGVTARAITQVNPTTLDALVGFNPDDYLLNQDIKFIENTGTGSGGGNTGGGTGSGGGSAGSFTADPDNYTGDNTDETLLALGGNDTVLGQGGSDTIDAGAGNDYIEGNAGNDSIALGSGYDGALGGDGDDTISGQGEADVIFGEAGNDELYGDAGNDKVVGQDGNDSIYGGSGNDTLQGNAGNDALLGGLGDDTIYAHNGIDFANGNQGNDEIHLGYDADNGKGGSGNDSIYGFDGDDNINGEAGDDFLGGGNGNDIIHGEAGADGVLAGNGDDQLNGGTGNDTLHGQAGADVIFAGAGNDEVTGGTGNDSIYGGSGSDVLQGNAGADAILGGNGNDQIYGESGNDWILGGHGQDYMNGGAGDDLFIFKATDYDNANKDKIGDFNTNDDAIKFVGYGNMMLNDLTIFQSGDNLKITNADDFGTKEIVLFNLDASDIADIDFEFA